MVSPPPSLRSLIVSTQMQAQSGVELSVLGSWSLPKEGQEGMESFLRDLSTIFPQERWLQINREVGKTGFTCQVLHRDQSKTLTGFMQHCWRFLLGGLMAGGGLYNINHTNHVHKRFHSFMSLRAIQFIIICGGYLIKRAGRYFIQVN